jgi:cytochrome P450
MLVQPNTDYRPTHRLDIMADLTVGESMHLLETQGYNPWLQGIFDQLFYASLSRVFQHFPSVWAVVQHLIPKSVHEIAEASVKYSPDRVDKRLAMETERPDIFGLVVKHAAESDMSRRVMHANADLLMMAGMETTASMLSGLTYHLLISPDSMRRLTREIRESFTTAEDITSDGLAKLPVNGDPAVVRKMLTISVSIRLHRRGPESLPFRQRGISPQDQRRKRCNNMRSLFPPKCKQNYSSIARPS